MIRICRSNSGFERREAARDFVRSFSPGTELLLIGATREAVDDLVQQIVLETGATFGLQRFSFMQLASFLAASELASAGRAPATALGTQAVAARAAFLAQQQAQIQRFTRVSHFPGFAPTLAATLNDLRLAGIETAALAEQTGGDHDLPVLLRLFGEELEKASIADRSTMLRLAARGLGKPHVGTLRSMPVLLLDLPIESKLERDLLRAVCEPAPAVLATVPAADRQTLEALEQIAPGEVVEPVAAAAGAVVKAPVSESTSLTRLRTFLFSDQAPEAGETDERVRFFSAPGEGRECVEIARLILNEARRGIAFDHMAVFLRAPDAYSALLDTAFRRAGVPSYFARGTKRPDPSGRAFLALLACRSERLSAKRFAEYLSFGQVPLPEDGGAPPRNRQVWSGPDDETLGAAGSPASLRAKGVEAGERSTPQQLMLWETDDDGSAGQQRKHDSSTTAEDDKPGQLQKHVSAKTATDAAEHTTTDSDEHPTLAGTLRAPWKWEELLVEAAVIGGKERWGRRLAGLEQELRLKCEAIAGEEPESPRLVALQRDITNLGHLARFAVPIIDALDAAPQSATWAEWVRVLSELAPMVLRRPERVLSVLAELQPMASVGPVSIDEVREVLSDRLSMLEQEPPEQRWGRLFVATPDQARGRTFKVVFVPGLAERVFPQRPREDPLLLDALRRQLSSELRTQEDRGHNERMLLRLALGAAEERVVLSYPRLAAVEARPRVPSFYALDVARAVRGSIPDYEQLEREAAERVQARLAWPAPPDPHDAIDAVEHDLAVLGRFLHVATASAGKGRARYLLELNAHLARSLRTRWLRWRDKWYPEDGLVRTTEITRALFDAQRLKARPYSVTALQKFAACPYQFLLSAIHRLEPRREAVALVQMDPLTRGRMFHHVQAETLRSLQRAGALPVTSAALEKAEFVLDATIERIEAA
ncbi:MAG: PD-(D/E)XK nuclease family protein, partial [Candidatus Krumholzibacteriia bacterium]